MMTSPGELATYWVAVHGTATGSAHLRRGEPCEDAADARSEGAWSAVAVADGHGSARHPRAARGAALAVAAAFDALLALPDSDLETVRAALGTLPESLHRSWTSRVRSDIGEKPLTEDEQRATGPDGPASELRAYGSTVLGAAGSDRCLALVQIGDGDIVVCHATERGAGRPICPATASDPRVTDSLCDADAVRRTRVALVDLVEYPVEAVLLATDGFGAAFDEPQWHDETARQLAAAVQEMSDDALATAVQDWCGPPAQVGGDDVSLGVLVPARRKGS